MLDSANLMALLTWGLTDRYADPPQSAKRRLVGWRDRKFPYDSDLAAKPLRTALARAFLGRKAA